MTWKNTCYMRLRKIYGFYETQCFFLCNACDTLCKIIGKNPIQNQFKTWKQCYVPVQKIATHNYQKRKASLKLSWKLSNYQAQWQMWTLILWLKSANSGRQAPKPTRSIQKKDHWHIRYWKRLREMDTFCRIHCFLNVSLLQHLTNTIWKSPTQIHSVDTTFHF